MSDPLKEPIFIMHTIFICCVFYIIIYNSYYLISGFLWSFGIGRLNFIAEIPLLAPLLWWIFYIPGNYFCIFFCFLDFCFLDVNYNICSICYYFSNSNISIYIHFTT